jgi:hypothetical protein
LFNVDVCFRFSFEQWIIHMQRPGNPRFLKKEHAAIEPTQIMCKTRFIHYYLLMHGHIFSSDIRKHAWCASTVLSALLPQ